MNQPQTKTPILLCPFCGGRGFEIEYKKLIKDYYTVKYIPCFACDGTGVAHGVNIKDVSVCEGV